ncbi:hypothetical protein HGT72_16280, partial [Rosenbergiella nectarea subsp. apis]|nr:hypothetical protein [Rosenbergiella nectarea subsp. apis]
MAHVAEKEIVSRPEYDENGRAHYSLPNARAEENLVVACPQVAEKVIPVIFLPGVMGSNLKEIDSDDKVWCVDMSLGLDALTWVFKSKKERKALLNPLSTEVDGRGTVLYDDLEGRVFPSRTARGWGSALYKSYGEALHVLQFMLNDAHILIDNLKNGTI